MVLKPHQIERANDLLHELSMLDLLRKDIADGEFAVTVGNSRVYTRDLKDGDHSFPPLQPEAFNRIAAAIDAELAAIARGVYAELLLLGVDAEGLEPPAPKDGSKPPPQPRERMTTPEETEEERIAGARIRWPVKD
jgi:hypothetical protein